MRQTLLAVSALLSTTACITMPLVPRLQSLLPKVAPCAHLWPAADADLVYSTEIQTDMVIGECQQRAPEGSGDTAPAWRKFCSAASLVSLFVCFCGWPFLCGSTWSHAVLSLRLPDAPLKRHLVHHTSARAGYIRVWANTEKTPYGAKTDKGLLQALKKTWNKDAKLQVSGASVLSCVASAT